MLDWKSFKLPCLSRSSLHGEAQASSEGVDALEYLMTLWSFMRDPPQDPRSDETAKAAGSSALVVDAKALYDAAQRENVSNIS